MPTFVTFSASARFVFLPIVWTHPDPKLRSVLRGSPRLSPCHSWIMQRRSLGPWATSSACARLDREPCQFSLGCVLLHLATTGRRCMAQMANLKAFCKCSELSKIPRSWTFDTENAAHWVSPGCKIKCWVVHYYPHLEYLECQGCRGRGSVWRVPYRLPFIQMDDQVSSSWVFKALCFGIFLFPIKSSYVAACSLIFSPK